MSSDSESVDGTIAMNDPIPFRKRLLATFVAVGLAAAFLFFGRDLWLVRGVTVSVGLKSSNPQICQVFWTESEKDSFRPERSAGTPSLLRAAGMISKARSMVWMGPTML